MKNGANMEEETDIMPIWSMKEKKSQPTLKTPKLLTFIYFHQML